MPKHKFEKGNPGRLKGSKNKFTDLKDAFLGAFEEVGGEEYVRQFAKSPLNRKDFLKMISGMLPKNIHMSGPEGTPLIPPVIQIVPVKKK